MVRRVGWRTCGTRKGMNLETQGLAAKLVGHCCTCVSSHWTSNFLGFEWKYLPKVLHWGAKNPIPCGIRQVPMSGVLVPVPHVPKDNIASVINRNTASTNSVLQFPWRQPALAFFLLSNKLKSLLLNKMGIWYKILLNNVNGWCNLVFFTCLEMCAPRSRHNDSWEYKASWKAKITQGNVTHVYNHQKGFRFPVGKRIGNLCLLNSCCSFTA